VLVLVLVPDALTGREDIQNDYLGPWGRALLNEH
jgi:hypothetical protein